MSISMKTLLIRHDFHSRHIGTITIIFFTFKMEVSDGSALFLMDRSLLDSMSNNDEVIESSILTCLGLEPGTSYSDQNP